MRQEDTKAAIPALPMERAGGCPFDPPTGFAEAREVAPLIRMTYPDGHEGWLATGYAEIRAIMADPRFSNRQELMHIPIPGFESIEVPPAGPGEFLGMDAPEHTRYRRLLTGKFTTRRMRALAEHIDEAVAELLDDMERQGPGLDLVPSFAVPLPALLICELLGVPAGDRERFVAFAVEALDPDRSLEDRDAANKALIALIADEVVPAKRSEPTDDVLSELTTSDLTDAELAGVGAFLLAAGLDTTANTLVTATYALLKDHPGQAAALRDEPDLAKGAVEEFLRYLSVVHTTTRAAQEDVEVAGQVIKKGETVTLPLHAANRDPERFADPDSLDLRRHAGGHLAFGHGVHQCVGQQLARIELQVALPALLRRFPTLRLAVSPDEVRMRPAANGIYGTVNLPVTWDEV